MPVEGSGVLSAASHATGWEDDEESDEMRFLGYIVTLEETADSLTSEAREPD